MILGHSLFYGVLFILIIFLAAATAGAGGAGSGARATGALAGRAVGTADALLTALFSAVYVEGCAADDKSDNRYYDKIYGSHIIRSPLSLLQPRALPPHAF